MRKRSKYNPRPLVIPLNIRNELKVEAPVWVVTIAAGSEWINKEHLADLYVHAVLAYRLAVDPEDKAQCKQLLDLATEVKDRYDRTGRVGFTGDQLRVLRELCSVSTGVVRKSPNRMVSKELRSWRV